MSDERPPAVLPLIETVERLWPGASQVSLVGAGGVSRSSAQRSWDLLAVPNARRPRVLVPAAGRAASSAVRRISAAVSTREVLERSAIGGALAVGGTRLLPDRIRILDPGDDHIVALLEEVMGQPVTVSLGIGTDRANRKPVLGVFDRSGRPIAFAKVGDSPVAGGHVRDEARALALVNEQDWSVVTTPELLAHRTWRGMEVMVMSALRPPAWRGRGVWPIPDDAADEVSRLFSSGRSTLVDSPMWRRCEDSVLAVGDDAIREVLVSAMSTVLDAAGDRQLDLGGFHGDFTPWNLARVGERTLLWDWERFETGVPRGFDRLHYAVNASLRAGGLKPESVLSGLGRAGAGSENESDQVLGAAYLVSVSCRYLTATAGSGEAAFVPRAAAVLAALSSHCDRLGPERRESAS